jgi:hypothetical protein
MTPLVRAKKPTHGVGDFRGSGYDASRISSSFLQLPPAAWPSHPWLAQKREKKLLSSTGQLW